MSFYSNYTPFYTRKTRCTSGALKKIILNLSTTKKSKNNESITNYQPACRQAGHQSPDINNQ
jgi:hypothetical protein